MLLVGDWQSFLNSVNARTSMRPPSDGHRLVGVVFAPDHIPETHRILWPAVKYWNVRSSDWIDFFWPGFSLEPTVDRRLATQTRPIVQSYASIAPRPARASGVFSRPVAAIFSSSRFIEFLRGYDRAVSKFAIPEQFVHFPSSGFFDGPRYSGGLDLLLLSVPNRTKYKIVPVELSYGVFIHLSRLNQIHSGLAVHELFESIFIHAEYQDPIDPLGGYRSEFAELSGLAGAPLPLGVVIRSLLSLGVAVGDISSIVHSFMR